MAQGWEFDETDTWEPVVPDTWQVPRDTPTPAADDETSAGWTDAARTDEEWVDAADWGMRADARVPYLESVAAGYLGEEPLAAGTARPAGPRDRTPADDPDARRLAQETVAGLRALGQRMIDPATRFASGVVRDAAARPVAGLPVRIALRSQERIAATVNATVGRVVAAAVADARTRGQEAARAGRAEAERRLREGLAEALTWTRTHAVAPLVDYLAPRLAEQVAARVLADAVPVIADRLRADEPRVADQSTWDDVAAAPRRRR